MQPLEHKDGGRCIGLKYLKVEGTWVLVMLFNKGVHVMNANASRRLTFVPLPANTSLFVSIGLGVDLDGKDFVALGSSEGEVVALINKGPTWDKENGTNIGKDISVSALASDPKTKVMVAGDSMGTLHFIKCDNELGWKSETTVKSKHENPVLALETLYRGDNIFVSALYSGAVQLISPQGYILASVQAHSRIITGICCHPLKSIFATCSDDTFANIFEVTGSREDKIDINL